MVEVLLNSIKNMLGVQSSQNKEFKEESVRNNKNIGSVLKDVSSMFSASRSINSKLSSSLSSIEGHTLSTSTKVDRTNVLLQESISIQTQMMTELKSVAKSIATLAGGAGGGNSGSIGGSPSLLQSATTALLSAIPGVAGVSAGAMANDFFGVNTQGGDTSGAQNTSSYQNASFSQPINFSGSTQKILDTIKAIESRGDYTTPNKAGASSASGAYQFIDSTWQSLTRKYGIGTEYQRAMFAPPQIQDAVAGKYVEEILSQNNNDVSKVPLVWYTGNPRGEMSQEAMASNRGMQAQQYQQKWLNVFGGAERDDSMSPTQPAYQSSGVQPQQNAMSTGGGRVFERQRELAGIRKLPLSDNLSRVLEQAASAAGVDVVVYSGGQAPKGTGGPRTGSTRHDNGNAADLYLLQNGRKLSDTNEQDRAIMAKFVSAAVAAGATGVGAGHGYMGASNIHVGFGRPATWGGAPWISAAATGVYSNEDLQAQGSGSQFGATSGADSYGGGLGGLFASMGTLFDFFGMGSLTGPGLMGMLSGFFGMPIGNMFDQSTTAAYGVQQEALPNEEQEQEPADQIGRSEGPGGPMVGSQEYKEYIEKIKKTDQTSSRKESDEPLFSSSNYEMERTASLIQSAALSKENEKRYPIEIPSNVVTEVGTTASRVETPTSMYASMQKIGIRATRNNILPMGGVLSPDPTFAQGITWKNRLTGLYV